MVSDTGPVLLIQFARAPQVGQVKTRMMPHLSAQQACDLHSELVLWTSGQLARSGVGDVELSVAGDTAHPLFAQCRGLGITRVSSQRGPDLGQRMFAALRDGLLRYSRVILVGSDCPGIDRAYLRQAVLALERAPVVLGPAADGGYVLIGARQIRQELFCGIAWGTAQVYGETAARLRHLGLDWVDLPTLADVDRPEDIAHWDAIKSGSAGR